MLSVCMSSRGAVARSAGAGVAAGEGRQQAEDVKRLERRKNKVTEGGSYNKAGNWRPGQASRLVI